jgi:hypothetical protein
MPELPHVPAAVLLILSFLGYMLLARKSLKLQWEFIPVAVFSAVACLCFIGGLFERLRETATGVLLGGLVGLAVVVLLLSVKHVRFRKRIPSIPLFQLGFFVGTALFLAQLAGQRLEHYDNFSHWAVVVKGMLSTDAFPTPYDDLIDFKNYPLGASSFIYYICRFAGNAQPVMLIAQGVLIFAAFYAIFGIIGQRRRFLLYAFLGLGLSTLSFFNLTVRINNLLVDFLLPILTLAVFAAAYRYRGELTKACLVIAPTAGLLTVVKTTGVVFAAIGLLYFLFMAIRHARGPFWRNALQVVGTIAFTLLPYFGWNRRMAGDFAQVDNKFDVSPTALDGLDAGKTAEDMQHIVRLFLESSLDLTTRPALGIAVFQVAAVAASLVAKFGFRKKWNLWKALIALDACLLLYYAGILAMYLFMMPLDEAIRLAGFERYASSIVVLFVGGLVMCAAIDLERSFYYQLDDVPPSRAFKSAQTKSIYQKGVWACLGLAVAILLSEYNGIQTVAQSYETTLPYKVEQVSGDRWYADGRVDESRYLFYSSDANLQVTNYYLQYIARYFLYAPNVDGIVLFYEDNMNNLLSGYDYLVVVEKDADAARLVKKHYNVDLEERIYKIVRNGDRIALIAD